LAPEYSDRALVRFQVTDDEALYKQFGKSLGNVDWPAHPKDEPWKEIDWLHRRSVQRSGVATAGYIIYTKELWPDGPGCLSLFGMSGPITFGFAAAVREILAPDAPRRLH